MENTDIKMLEKYKKRIKTQNEAAKENWDMVSCRLPKGTKNRIKALGLSVNGVINKSVLSFLESAEKEHKEELERLESQTEPTEPQETYQTKQDQKQEKEEAKPTNNNPEAKPMTLEEAQAILDRKRAEQKEQKEMMEKAKQERKEQEEAKEREEISKIIDRIIRGEDS